MQPRQDYTRDNNFSSLPHYDEAFGPPDLRIYVTTAPAVNYDHHCGRSGQSRFVSIEELTASDIDPRFNETDEVRDGRIIGCPMREANEYLHANGDPLELLLARDEDNEQEFAVSFAELQDVVAFRSAHDESPVKAGVYGGTQSSRRNKAGKVTMFYCHPHRVDVTVRKHRHVAVRAR